MKKLFATLTVMAVLGFVAIPANAILGVIYENTTTPGNGYNNVNISKTSEVTCTSVFGIIGVGNCSINAAMKAGRINSLAYYDVITKNILGFQRLTIKAYGN